MAKAVLTFALYQGDAFQRHETVTQDIVKVGKDPKSHLRVDDEQASRMHAVIEVAGPDDITLIDLGNEPGTLVNGARVNKCKLHVGDQIRRHQIGELELAGVEFMQIFPRRHAERKRQQVAGSAHIEGVFGETADVAFDDHQVLRRIARRLGVVRAIAHPDLVNADMRGISAAVVAAAV